MLASGRVGDGIVCLFGLGECGGRQILRINN